MTEKQEILKSCTRKLYIEDNILNDLREVGTQGVLMNNIMNYHDAIHAVKCLNILSLKQEMFPSLAFSALSYMELSNVRCVIIGGMPNMDKIECWTGSGYSYDLTDEMDGSNPERTMLHKKIIEDQHGITKYTNPIELDNYKLQMNGVLLLHDAMSVTKESPTICRNLWSPIIFRILNEISKENHSVPIVFTTTTSRNIYGAAVLSSDNVMCLHFVGDSIMPLGPNVFEYLEDSMNKGKAPSHQIDFLKLITKWK